MDVRCDKCGSEYDLEETRIPEAGLSVKCSQCSHVFKAFRPSTSLPPAKGGDEWMIRQATGNVFRFRELTTLQRWIVERKVSRTDEISKTGNKWERLGNIPELVTFFQLVEESARGMPPMIGAQQAQAWVGPAVPSQRNHAWESGKRAPDNVESDGGYTLGDDDSTQYDGRPRRRRVAKGRALWLAVGGVVALAGLGGGFLASRPDAVRRFWRERFETVPPAALRELAEGYAQLARDDDASLTEAENSMRRAVATAADHGPAHAGLAEVSLAKLELMVDEATKLEQQVAKAAEPERTALTQQLESKRTEVARALEDAAKPVEKACALDAEELTCNRAMARLLAARGDRSAIEPYVKRVRAHAPDDAWLAYLLGHEAMNESPERAIRYLDIALEQAPGLQRARYRLAQLYVAAGQLDRALEHAKRIVNDVPQHERARALVGEIELAKSPPPPPDPVAPPVPPETPAAPVAPTTEAPKGPQTFDALVRQADRLRQSDRPAQALKLFERAREQEPENVEVLAGMGLCYVDLENAAAAIETLKEALRIAPKYVDAHMGLAEAYRLRNMKRDAIKHYRAYLDIMPDGPEAAVAKRMIEQLGGEAATP